jgi:hypothetical protein
MLSAAVVALEFFVNGEGISKLVLVASCTALSAFVSFAMNIRPWYYSSLRDGRVEYKAAFEFIGAWNEAITMNTAEHDSFGRFAVETVARLNAVCNQIDSYMSFQEKRCSYFLEKMPDCENMFGRLAKTAKKCIDSFSGFQRRLDAINASLLYFRESGSIENEMSASLIDELRLRTNELDRQIQGILSKLEIMGFKTSQFTNFVKPYRQMMGIYSTRLESALDSIDRKNRVGANLVEIIALTLDAARVFKNGIDAFRSDAEAKILAAREEMTKTVQSTVNQVMAAEARANAAEAKIQAANAEAAAAKEQAVSLAARLVQAGKTNEEYKALRKKYRTFLAVGVAALVISIGIGMNKNDLYNSISLKYQALETRHDALLNDYNNSKDIWGIHVTSLKVGNADKNNKWITKPGEHLNANDIRFLNPYLTVDSLISGNITFYIKIIAPDGTVNRNPSVSPEGFTFHRVRYLATGKNQDIDLDGWGNGDMSTYEEGAYTIEVWYEGVRLIAENVTLN